MLHKFKNNATMTFRKFVRYSVIFFVDCKLVGLKISSLHSFTFSSVSHHTWTMVDVSIVFVNISS